MSGAAPGRRNAPGLLRRQADDPTSVGLAPFLPYSAAMRGAIVGRVCTYGVYAATKGAVEAMTLILARELRGRDVTVNAVAPGPTATPFFFEGKSRELIDTIANAMRRLGESDDIAEVVSFLAGPGHWVNGQTIYANGGAI